MAQSNAERQKAYRERNASRNVTEAVTGSGSPSSSRADWPWDEHHIYQKCPHGMRYCLKCGTAKAAAPNPTPEQWSDAYRAILAGIERRKNRDKAA